MAVIPDDTKVREIMAAVCEKNGVPELEGQTKVEWNARFTRRMGDANYNKMRVRFSIPLFARATEVEQEETIAHEMAHIVAHHRFGNGIKAHGGQWQACMLRAGYQPERCHNIDRTGLKRTTKTCKTYCACKIHMVTKRVFNRIENGSRYTCAKCKTVLLTSAHPAAPVKEPKPQSATAQKPTASKSTTMLVIKSRKV